MKHVKRYFLVSFLVFLWVGLSFAALPKEEVKYFWDGENWKPHLRILYQYNSADNISSKTTQFQIQDAWADVYRAIYSYDVDTRLTEIYTRMNFDDGWHDYQRVTYSYNGSGKCESKVIMSKDGDNWRTDETIIYSYNTDGLKSEELHSFEDMPIPANYHILYEYLPNHQLFRETSERLIGEEWVLYDINEYRYNDDMLVDSLVRYVGEEGNYLSQDIYFYDNDNYLDHSDFYWYFSGGWQLADRYVYSYDNYYNNTSIVKLEWNGENWISDELVEYKYDPITAVTEDDQNLPSSFELEQNYPNPFNPSTMIEFTLKSRANVKLDIYNVLGQKVNTLVDEELSAGRYEYIWDGNQSDGTPASTGIYFYRLRTDGASSVKKMILLK